MKLQHFAIEFAIACIASSVSLAQTNTATLTGVVLDRSQAVVSRAEVQISSHETGVVKKTVVNEIGQFNFNFLPPGTYDLTAAAPEFQTLDRKDLSLVAGQVLRLDLELTVGSIQESVNVSGEAPLVNLATSDQLRTITYREVDRLPQPKLDWTVLTNLSTGISAISASVSPGATGSIAMNGMSPEAMSFTVDGTNASSDPEEPAFGFYQQPNVINTVNTDAIGEVSLVKGILPASVGGTTSGNVNIITKSGTNQFHGDVYEVNEVSSFDARNQFLPARLRTTFNQFGGALGGPILRNRFFFFGSYEGVRWTSFQALSGNVPTPYLISISPAVYGPIFAALPKVPQPPNNPTALTALYNGAASQVQNDSNTAERFDYYLSPSNQLTFRYTRSAPYKNAPRLVAVDPRVTEANNDMYNASFTHTSGRWTSSTRFGYSHLYTYRVDQGFNIGLASVSFTGFSSSGAEYYILNGGTQTVLQDFAWNRGRHSLEFGGVFQRQATGRIDLNTANFSYSSLADFQANIPNSITITFDVPSSVLHMYQFGGYLQDNYRVSPSLVLNLGVRYDYFTVPKEGEGRLFNRGIDPNRPQLGYGFGPYRPADSIYDADHKDIQPRVGFAWSPGVNRKTVIRGGSGLFAGARPMFAGPVTEMQAGPDIPFRAIFSRPQILTAGLGYPIAQSNFVPLLRSLQSSGVLSSQVASNTTIDPNFPNPLSIQWMLGVEREIGFSTTLSVNYVGNRALNLLLNQQENLPARLTGIAPDPTFPIFMLNTVRDESNYHSVQVSLGKRFSHGILFRMNYTHARNMAYGAGDVLGGSKPQDPNDLRAEYGPTIIDIRDAFNGSFAYDLPFQKIGHRNGRAATLLLGGWQLSSIVTARTGLPFNITNSSSSYPADRPDVVAGIQPIFANYRSTLQYLNPAAFLAPPIVPVTGAQARPGNLSRNALFLPGLWLCDMTLAKSLALTERWRLRLRWDAFNALNHTNLGGLSTNVSSGSFGRLTSATPRNTQVSARLEF